MFLYHALSPWLALVDQDKYEPHVDRCRALGAERDRHRAQPVITEPR